MFLILIVNLALQPQSTSTAKPFVERNPASAGQTATNAPSLPSSLALRAAILACLPGCQAQEPSLTPPRPGGLRTACRLKSPAWQAQNRLISLGGRKGRPGELWGVAFSSSFHILICNTHTRAQPWAWGSTQHVHVHMHAARGMGQQQAQQVTHSSSGEDEMYTYRYKRTHKGQRYRYRYTHKGQYNNNNNRRLVTLAEHTSDHGRQTNSSTEEKGEQV